MKQGFSGSLLQLHGNFVEKISSDMSFTSSKERQRDLITLSHKLGILPMIDHITGQSIFMEFGEGEEGLTKQNAQQAGAALRLLHEQQAYPYLRTDSSSFRISRQLMVAVLDLNNRQLIVALDDAAYPATLRRCRRDTAQAHGLLARTLPKAEWTHEAHLAACTWIVRERPDIVTETDLPRIISRYNESVGGVNDDTQGYHETITQVYIAAVRAFAARHADLSLVDLVNALLEADEGRRDWPLRSYSHERLFSAEARPGFVDPDLAQLAAIA